MTGRPIETLGCTELHPYKFNLHKKRSLFLVHGHFVTVVIKWNFKLIMSQNELNY